MNLLRRIALPALFLIAPTFGASRLAAQEEIFYFVVAAEGGGEVLVRWVIYYAPAIFEDLNITYITRIPLSSVAPSGLAAGTVATVGGSVTAIVGSGVMIYYNNDMNNSREEMLRAMEAPPEYEHYYNPSVPLDMYDPFYHLYNYRDYFLGGYFSSNG